jgi:hypothetical protein
VLGAEYLVRGTSRWFDVNFDDWDKSHQRQDPSIGDKPSQREVASMQDRRHQRQVKSMQDKGHQGQVVSIEDRSNQLVVCVYSGVTGKSGLSASPCLRREAWAFLSAQASPPIVLYELLEFHILSFSLCSSREVPVPCPLCRVCLARFACLVSFALLCFGPICLA